MFDVTKKGESAVKDKTKELCLLDNFDGRAISRKIGFGKDPMNFVMETTDREPSSDVTSLTSSDTSERHVADQRLQRGRELLERGRQGKKNEKQTTLAGFLPRRHRSETPSKRLRSDSQSPPMPHEKTARTFAAEKSLNSGQASSSTAEGSGT
nr:hypothetical protein BaRGS_009196 [Batillaria attramentaria]